MGPYRTWLYLHTRVEDISLHVTSRTNTGMCLLIVGDETRLLRNSCSPLFTSSPIQTSSLRPGPDTKIIIRAGQRAGQSSQKNHVTVSWYKKHKLHIKDQTRTFSYLDTPLNLVSGSMKLALYFLSMLDTTLMASTPWWVLISGLTKLVGLGIGLRIHTSSGRISPVLAISVWGPRFSLHPVCGWQ